MIITPLTDSMEQNVVGQFKAPRLCVYGTQMFITESTKVTSKTYLKTIQSTSSHIFL
jgi:hypothetical protein